MLYDLCALQRHHGDELDAGHYTARIRGAGQGDLAAADQMWFEFDDNSVPVPLQLRQLAANLFSAAAALARTLPWPFP